MRSPQRQRELTSGWYSRKRKELIEETSREEKRQRQALYARFPKDHYTRTPAPIGDNQWERQQNKDLLTCYLASAINSLRGLGQGVYDSSQQTEDRLREIMEKRLNFSPEEFALRYRNGVDQIILGEGLRNMAGNVVNVTPSSSVLDILNAVENGAAAIVPVSDNHVAAIYPGSRVFYRGNELRIQVVDSLLGVRDVSVEALLQSEITLEEAAARVIDEMHRFASPGIIVSRKAYPSHTQTSIKQESEHTLDIQLIEDLIQQRKFQNASKQIEALERQYSGQQAIQSQLAIERGKVAVERSLRLEAYTAIEQAIRFDPTNTQAYIEKAYLLLGKLFGKKNDAQAALDIIEDAKKAGVVFNQIEEGAIKANAESILNKQR